MPWRRLLAYITGTVDEDLRLRNEYLAAENRILRAKLPKRIPLKDRERSTLARIGRKLGLHGLAGLSAIVKPETILAWHRRLVAKKFDGSKNRGPGRPRIARKLEELIVRLAIENKSWGYDRIVGALDNLGHVISDETIGNVLKRNGIPPAPERKQTTTRLLFIRRGRPGLSSSAPTRTFSRPRTSSLSRSGRREDLSPTTCCSSSTSLQERWRSLASHLIRMKIG